MYWIRQKCATLFPSHFKSLSNNSAPSCNPDHIPPFYKKLLAVFRENRSIYDLFNKNNYDPLVGKVSVITNKNIYNLIISTRKNYQHTCIRLFKDNYIKLKLEIDWQNIWSISFKSYTTNKMNETTWFLRHYAHYTGEKIFKMYPHLKRPNCPNCKNIGTEHILHAFALCENVKPVWDFFSSYFSKILESDFSIFELTLGTYTARKDITFHCKKLAFLITVVVNHFIWKSRNKNKYENKNISINHQGIISLSLHEIKIIINTYYKLLGSDKNSLAFPKRFCIGHALCMPNPLGGVTFTF